MKKQLGFTLVELIITITVLGVLTAMAIPSMSSLFNNSKVKTSTDSIVGILQQARSEAIRTGHNMTICASSDRTNCVTTNPAQWQVGIIMKDAVNGKVYKVLEFNNSDIQIAGPASNGVLTYTPFGTITGAQQITVNMTGVSTYSICVLPIGRADSIRGSTCS